MTYFKMKNDFFKKISALYYFFAYLFNVRLKRRQSMR